MRIVFDLHTDLGPAFEDTIAARAKMLEVLVERNELILRRMNEVHPLPPIEDWNIRIDDEVGVGIIGDAHQIIRNGRGSIEAVSAFRVALLRVEGKKAKIRYESLITGLPPRARASIFVTTKVILEGDVVDPWLEGLREALRKSRESAPLDQATGRG